MTALGKQWKNYTVALNLSLNLFHFNHSNTMETVFILMKQILINN